MQKSSILKIDCHVICEAVENQNDLGHVRVRNRQMKGEIV